MVKLPPPRLAPRGRSRAVPRDLCRPGAVVAGRYAVERVLDRGPIATLEAEDRALGRRVVVRVLPAAMSDAGAVKRFERELQALRAIGSRHVAATLDVGTLPDGATYFVRPYVEGVSMEAYAAQHGGLPVPVALALFFQVCEAVEEAHAQGVVLRDLQPRHVFLSETRSGELRARVTDFGLCKITRDPDAADEQTCTRLGGLSGCASPELVRGQQVDRRADVWSLGALLHVLLCGAAPFAGAGPQLMLSIVYDAPIAPRARRDDVPELLERCIAWALDKDPAARPVSAYALARALWDVADTEGHVAIRRMAGTAGVPQAPTPTPAPRAVIPVAASAAPAAAPSDPGRSAQMSWIRVATPVPARSKTRAAAGWLLGVAATAALVALVIGGLTATPSAAPAAAVTQAASPSVVAMTTVNAGAEHDSDVGAEEPAHAPHAAPAKRTAPRSVTAVNEKTKARRRPTGPRRAEVEREAPPPRAEAESPARTARSTRPSRSPKRATSEPHDPAAPGTLVAMAIGASCRFSIDGQPRGQTSSVRVQVAPGRHSVSCSTGGTTRTRSVVVKAGKAAVATFQL